MDLLIVAVFVLFIHAAAFWSWLIAYNDDAQSSRMTKPLTWLLILIVTIIDCLLWKGKI